MIRVRRSLVPSPAILLGPKGEDERARVKAFYDIEANRSRPFEFKIYSDAEVLAALNRLFHRKCAYCESKVTGDISDPNIEHWRPKGAIRQLDGTTTKPGYYWRASSWENLLLSCTKCNQRRRYPTRLTDGARTETLGKGDFFPLADALRVARCEIEEADEEPLLLDPCRHDGARYLEVIVTHVEPDAIGLVRPRAARGRAREVAEVTIRLYALNRPALVEARRNTITSLRQALGDLCDAIDLHAEATTRQEPKLRAIVARRAEEVARFISGEAPYQLLCRTVLAEFVAQRPAIGAALLAGLEA